MATLSGSWFILIHPTALRLRIRHLYQTKRKAFVYLTKPPLGTRFDWIESNRESNQISRSKLPVNRCILERTIWLDFLCCILSNQIVCPQTLLLLVPQAQPTKQRQASLGRELLNRKVNTVWPSYRFLTFYYALTRWMLLTKNGHKKQQMEKSKIIVVNAVNNNKTKRWYKNTFIDST